MTYKVKINNYTFIKIRMCCINKAIYIYIYIFTYLDLYMHFSNQKCSTIFT